MSKTPNIRVYIVLLALACCVLCMYVGYSVWAEREASMRAEFVDNSEQLNYRLSGQLNDILQVSSNNAFLAANSPALSQALISPGGSDALKSVWDVLMQATPILYQIRYIDAQGEERFRMERKNGETIWIESSNLQFKGERDYVKQGLSVEESLYLSAVDLNRELGEIERPYRPTVRMVAKYGEGSSEENGLLVMNFDLRETFAFFRQQQSTLRHWIINKNGNYISSPDQQDWSWLLNSRAFAPSILDGSAIEGNIKSVDDNQWIDKQKYVSVVRLNAPLNDVYLEDKQFWIVSQLSGSTLSALRTFGLNIAIVLVIFILIIMAVARYVDILALRMRASQHQSQELAARAQASEKAKASFLAQMSHEIRTPMNGLYGLLQLSYTEKDPKTVHSNLKNAIRSFDTLKRIIDDILDFSKIEAGKLTLIKQRFALDIALRDIAQMMSRAAYGKNIDMWIDIDPDCPREIVGDAIRINQVLFNLTNNAIKFTEDGEIRVTVKLLSKCDTQVQLGFVVSDTGIGMNEKQLNKAFDAFTQANDETHSKFGGSGLGLSIVKRLIGLMDGDIKVTSERGRGTFFSFNLWLDKAEDAVSFGEPVGQNDELYLQALIITPSPISRNILKKHVATLGWLSHSLESVLGLEAMHDSMHLSDKKPDNAQRQILLIDDTADLDAQALHCLNNYVHKHQGTITLLINKSGAERHLSIKDKVFDLVLNKPVTPSAIYDSVLTHVNAQNPQKIERKPALASKSLQGIRILIVEDNEINQMVAATMLEDAGALTYLANNGQEAIDKLSRFEVDFDAVLMDMQMPVLDGISATIELRKKSAFDHIPIIALTANAMDEEREQCYQAGMQAHVAKPIERAALIQSVLSVISDYQRKHS